MITSKLKIIAASALLLAAGASRGNTVDFDSYSSALLNPEFGFYAGPLVTQGFSFTSEATPTNHFHLINSLAQCTADGYSCVNNGTQYLGQNAANIIMSQVGGGGFTLAKFDATNSDMLYHMAKTIVVEGTLVGGGSVSQNFDLTPSSFTTFTLNASFTNLASVTFRGAGPAGKSDNLWIAVDNINTDSAVPPGPQVPEPETYAMLLAGLGVVTALARRRRG